MSPTPAAFPTEIELAFATPGGADAVFDALMAALCTALRADRCFLYLRDPATGWGAVVACAAVEDRWPDLRSDPAPEPPDLAVQDPLMAWAHRSATALFVDDVETAGPDVLDLDFERDGYGHRALVHAPIVDPWPDGALLGILEPCVFGAVRHWSEADRALVASVQIRLGPLVAASIASGRLASSYSGNVDSADATTAAD